MSNNSGLKAGIQIVAGIAGVIIGAVGVNFLMSSFSSGNRNNFNEN